MKRPKRIKRYYFANETEWYFDGDSFQIKNNDNSRGIYLSGTQEFGRLIDFLRYMNDINKRFVRCKYGYVKYV